MIKLLVADSSAVDKSVVKQIISISKDLTLVGEASSFDGMLTEIQKCKPDILLIDFKLLNTTSLFSAYNLLKTVSVPILLFVNPNMYDEKEIVAKRNIIICRKPDLFCLSTKQITEYAGELAEKLNEFKQSTRFNIGTTASSFKFNYSSAAGGNSSSSTDAKLDKSEKKEFTEKKYKAVLIGVSTGGPGTIQRLLSDLGSTFPIPILITQHIDSNFDKNLIEWLDNNTKLPVMLAEDNMVAENGKVYFAPADYHLVLMKDELGKIILRLNHDDPVNFLRPAVDKMFDSAAEVLGDSCLAVLLTGMGADGAEGCVRIKNKGGYTITEAEESCIIYGMPKAAFEAGGSTEVLPLKDIAKKLQKMTGADA